MQFHYYSKDIGQWDDIISIDSDALYGIENANTLSLEAFKVCNLDEIDGLNWDEVEQCEDEFCKMLTITCPTKTDFESFDANGDSILTIKEYQFNLISIFK